MASGVRRVAYEPTLSGQSLPPPQAPGGRGGGRVRNQRQPAQGQSSPLSGFGVARLEHAAAAFAFSSGMAGGSELWIGDSNPIDRRSLCRFLGVVKVRNEIGWWLAGFPVSL